MDERINTNFLFDLYYLVAGTMLLFAIITLIFSINSLIVKRNILAGLMSVYLIGVLAQGLGVLLIMLYGTLRIWRTFDFVSARIFDLLEFVVFSAIYLQILKGRKIRLLVKLILFAYPLVLIAHWIFENALIDDEYSLTFIGTIYLLLLCLIYFYELFLFPPTILLRQNPHFWIATGTLIYFVSLIPQLVLLKSLSFFEGVPFSEITYINFVASILLYLSFIKALLCKPEPKKFFWS